jgi:predicted nucleic acid-binding protein
MIVDANIATYWYVPSPFSAAATAYMNRVDLVAPQILLPEAANALQKYFRAGQISLPDLYTAIDRIPRLVEEFVSDTALTPMAVRLSIAHNHKIYDCLYLALALDRREPLATADRRMAVLAQSLSIETQLIEPQP